MTTTPVEALIETTRDAIFDQAFKDDAFCLSRSIHHHAELAFKEVQSSKLLADYLESKGFAVERGVSGLETAFVARFSLDKPGPSVAYISEFDALKDIGHACAHNLIAISGVAAAIGAKACMEKHELGGTILLIGTPGEEGGAGKIIMLKDEHGPSPPFRGVDAVLMLHGSGSNTAQYSTLASQRISLEFFGKASHAAGAPHLGINALDAANLAYTGVGLLRQHIRDKERIHGIITSGGQAANVVPDHTT
ncbi:hypothetical protein GQ42DRAFT_128099, partial [Ramicandelaber brevisporus]